MIKTGLLIFILLSSCTLIQDESNSVKNYYTELLQGQLGCLKENLAIGSNFKTSGLCGSVDTLEVTCKSKEYICTITSSTEPGNIAHITDSAGCIPQIKCAEKAK